GSMEYFWIGQDKICRRYSVDDLAHVILETLLAAWIEPFETLHGCQQMFGRQQIRLLNEIEQRIFLPGVVDKAPVSNTGTDYRIHRLAKNFQNQIAAELHLLLPEINLLLRHSNRIQSYAVIEVAAALSDRIHRTCLGIRSTLELIEHIVDHCFLKFADTFYGTSTLRKPVGHDNSLLSNTTGT